MSIEITRKPTATGFTLVEIGKSSDDLGSNPLLSPFNSKAPLESDQFPAAPFQHAGALSRQGKGTVGVNCGWAGGPFWNVLGEGLTRSL